MRLLPRLPQHDAPSVQHSGGAAARFGEALCRLGRVGQEPTVTQASSRPERQLQVGRAADRRVPESCRAVTKPCTNKPRQCCGCPLPSPRRWLGLRAAARVAVSAVAAPKDRCCSRLRAASGCSAALGRGRLLPTRATKHPASRFAGMQEAGGRGGGGRGRFVGRAGGMWEQLWRIAHRSLVSPGFAADGAAAT